MIDRARFANLGVVFAILAVAAWVTVPAIGLISAEEVLQGCPNGPMMADLTGAEIAGKTPKGTVQFRNRDKDRLVVKVRGVGLPENTALSVFVGDTTVGQITLPKNGNGELSLDTTTAAITEGATVTVRNGDTVILTGTLACVAKPGNSPTPGTRRTPRTQPTTSPTASPTATPTASPTVMPTETPTATPTPSPTVTPDPSPSPTPSPGLEA